MNEIVAGIFQNAPIWVWPLFVILLAVGLLASRQRKSSAIPYLFLPLFGLMAANAINGLVHVPMNWLAFGLFYIFGAALAFKWQDSLVLEKTGWRLELKGEWGTLTIIMIIFFSNFVNGVFEAVLPNVRGMMVFTVLFAATVGACSGSFMGRALRVLTLKTR